MIQNIFGIRIRPGLRRLGLLRESPGAALRLARALLFLLLRRLKADYVLDNSRKIDRQTRVT
jgi:hypothetical protein